MNRQVTLGVLWICVAGPGAVGKKEIVMRGFLVASAVLAFTGCQPITPTSPTIAVAPSLQAPTLYEMSGRVLLRFSPQTPIPNATVTILDGRNAGKSAVTDGLGRYKIGDLVWEGFSATVAAPGYISEQRGIDLNFSNSFDMLPVEIFSRSGTGAAVVDIPSHVPQLHLQFSLATGSCQSLQVVTVTADGTTSPSQTWVLGPVDFRQRCDEANWWGRPVEFDVSANGGRVQVVRATGINWTMTEKR